MFRTFVAALLGYVVIGVLIFGTDHSYAALVPGFSSMKPVPTWYFLASMATDTIYTMLGGWLCAVISKRELQAKLGLILMGELMGLVSTVYLWNTVPHYYSLYLLAAYPPAVWYGAKLRTSTAA
jgi:hypothetical protein